jgi:hypothetical protein
VTENFGTALKLLIPKVAVDASKPSNPDTETLRIKRAAPGAQGPAYAAILRYQAAMPKPQPAASSYYLQQQKVAQSYSHQTNKHAGK